jgi:transcriptional regulator with XRE-family HTH domain
MVAGLNSSMPVDLIDKRAVGNRLREFRRQTLGFSGTEMARILGISSKRYNNWERGYSIPASHVASLWRRFFVDPRWLWFGEGQPPEPIRPRSSAKKVLRREQSRTARTFRPEKAHLSHWNNYISTYQTDMS